MPKFSDSSGREWNVNLNVGLIDKVKEDADVDLDLILQKPDAFADIIQMTPRKLVQMMWVLCEDQAIERDIEPRKFGFLFDRDTVERASNVLMEAVLLFYPRSAAGKAITGKLPQLLAKMDQQIEKQTADRMDKVLSNIATDSRG